MRAVQHVGVGGVLAVQKAQVHRRELERTSTNSSQACEHLGRVFGHTGAGTQPDAPA